MVLIKLIKLKVVMVTTIQKMNQLLVVVLSLAKVIAMCLMYLQYNHHIIIIIIRHHKHKNHHRRHINKGCHIKIVQEEPRDV